MVATAFEAAAPITHLRLCTALNCTETLMRSSNKVLTILTAVSVIILSSSRRRATSMSASATSTDSLTSSSSRPPRSTIGVAQIGSFNQCNSRSAPGDPLLRSDASSTLDNLDAMMRLVSSSVLPLPKFDAIWKPSQSNMDKSAFLNGLMEPQTFYCRKTSTSETIWSTEDYKQQRVKLHLPDSNVCYFAIDQCEMPALHPQYCSWDEKTTG